MTFDEYDIKLSAWARFSKDEKMRFRLARMLTPAYRIAIVDGRVMGLVRESSATDFVELRRVVFLLVNPSTATAFKSDRTVDKCILFALHWGMQVVEIVNLFAFRSTYPEDLKIATDRGDGAYNDEMILAACRGASRVVAGWGNHGAQFGRDEHVRTLLKDAGIQLEHLGLTGDKHPLHPLARGKHFIPIEREPVVWS